VNTLRIDNLQLGCISSGTCKAPHPFCYASVVKCNGKFCSFLFTPTYQSIQPYRRLRVKGKKDDFIARLVLTFVLTVVIGSGSGSGSGQVLRIQ
jgi:hypothetical protein